MIVEGQRVVGALYPGDLRWKAGEPGKLYEATFMAWDAEGDAAVDLDGEVTYFVGDTVEPVLSAAEEREERAYRRDEESWGGGL